MVASKEYYKKYLDFTNLGNDKGVTAPHKMKIAIKMLNRVFDNENLTIADIGGVYGSYVVLKDAFPNSTIWSVNLVKEQLEGCEKAICEDISEKCSLNSDFFDLVYFGDVIEHLVEPDKAIKEIKRILKRGGYVLLTTPNLASLINRFSLLFGFAPTNYHPSERRHGSLFGVKQSSWHKSVFSVGAMIGFLKEYNFRVVSMKGFSYQKSKFTKFVNFILPVSLQEGMIVLAQK